MAAKVEVIFRADPSRLRRSLLKAEISLLRYRRLRERAWRRRLWLSFRLWRLERSLLVLDRSAA